MTVHADEQRSGANVYLCACEAVEICTDWSVEHTLCQTNHRDATLTKQRRPPAQGSVQQYHKLSMEAAPPCVVSQFSKDQYGPLPIPYWCLVQMSPLYIVTVLLVRT